MKEFIACYYKEIIEFIIAIVGWSIAIVKIIVSKKNKRWADFKKEVKEELKPLMEQAEKFLSDGQDREDWVVKKLGEKLHIDFYKYTEMLSIVLEVIKEVCEDTKTDINKEKIIVKKETSRDETEANIY